MEKSERKNHVKGKEKKFWIIYLKGSYYLKESNVFGLRKILNFFRKTKHLKKKTNLMENIFKEKKRKIVVGIVVEIVLCMPNKKMIDNR